MGFLLEIENVIKLLIFQNVGWLSLSAFFIYMHSSKTLFLTEPWWLIDTWIYFFFIPIDLSLTLFFVSVDSV